MKKLQKLLAVPALALTIIPTNAFSVSKTTNVKVSIPESLALTLNTDSLTFNLEDANLHTDKLTIAASTNSAAGYTISFNTNNNYNDLKHSNILVEDKIESITENKTETTFPETAWAYSTDLSDYTFKKIPLEAENIFTTTEKGENNHDFTVGVRANNLAAGDYKNELIFTAIVNPEPEPTKTLSSILNMQDITPEICATSAENESKQLIDVRDNKTYWVTKLADGNCWMTQNLDYDLSIAENQTLIPRTSNVIENRIVTPTEWDTVKDSVHYMDLGDTYFIDGITITEGYSLLQEDDINRHYAAGSYYSWGAATAGQGTTNVKGTDISESICPAGWRLPETDLDDTGTANYGFGNLLKYYGYSGSNYSTLGDSILRASPLFFNRGGAVFSAGNAHNGVINNQGLDAGYWSSRVYGYNTASAMFFKEGGVVNPSYFMYGYIGYPIRCVAL